MKTVNFTAEVSSNHNNNLERSLKFIDEASKSGCTSVKFQLFKIEELFSEEILSKSKTHRDICIIFLCFFLKRQRLNNQTTSGIIHIDMKKYLIKISAFSGTSIQKKLLSIESHCIIKL